MVLEYEKLLDCYRSKHDVNLGIDKIGVIRHKSNAASCHCNTFIKNVSVGSGSMSVK